MDTPDEPTPLQMAIAEVTNGKTNTDGNGEFYKISQKLGRGSFGTVYVAALATEFNPNHSQWIKVAAKLEKLCVDSALVHEYNAYEMIERKKLNKKIEAIGFPKCYGIHKTDKHRILFIELLGKSLDDKFNALKTFSLKTILQLGLQCIDRLKTLHECGMVYRDVKPENFCLGLNSTNAPLEKVNMVHLLDFGLVKRYRFPGGRGHIAFGKNKGTIGTARYISLNAHKGYEQSRRDDMTSLAIMLIYFHMKKLPWQGLGKKRENGKPPSRRTLVRDIGHMKKEEIPKLFVDATVPFALREILRDTMSLEFEREPPYQDYKDLLNEEATRQGIVLDGRYEWNDTSGEATASPRMSSPSRSRSPDVSRSDLTRNMSQIPNRGSVAMAISPITTSRTHSPSPSGHLSELTNESVGSPFGPKTPPA